MKKGKIMRLQSPDPHLVAVPRQTQDFLFSSGKSLARVGFLHRCKAFLTLEPWERAPDATAAVPSPRLQRPHPAAVAPSLRAWLRPGRGPPPHSGRRELRRGRVGGWASGARGGASGAACQSGSYKAVALAGGGERERSAAHGGRTDPGEPNVLGSHGRA